MRSSSAQKIEALVTELAETNARLEDIVSSLPGVVWEARDDPTSESQKITYISSYVEEMLGYPLQDWLNVPNFWMKIVHPDDRDKAVVIANMKYRGSGHRVNQFRWIAKDGREIWIEAQSVVIRDKQGKPIGMRGLNMDITATKLLEKQKDEFMSVVSHELKTPITTVKAFVDLLEIHNQKTGDQKSLDYLAKLDNQIDKITKLIRDMLDVSRIQAGKMEFSYSDFDIYDLVSEVALDMQLISTKHKIKVKQKFHTQIHADRYRLAQVLTNLISNATKYSPESNLVNVNLRKMKDSIVIGIQDFGIGITKQKAKLIFNRFYQVDNLGNTNAEVLPSLGLGLYISSEIIKRHNGEIWVESEEGKGSIFYIKLPLREAK